jgi:hypothetical protein
MDDSGIGGHNLLDCAGYLTSTRGGLIVRESISAFIAELARALMHQCGAGFRNFDSRSGLF